MAEVLTVNVVHTIRRGYFQDTAIDKRPVPGPVAVTAEGLAGDRQVNRSHGGPDKAVYAYASEDAAYWADELGREIPRGLFGDNLTTGGLEVSNAVVGERWRVGGAVTGVLFEVRMPRTPCENLSARMGIDGFHQRFNASGRVGALLKVLEPGEVAAGDAIHVVTCPVHGVTVRDLAVGATVVQMRALLDSDVTLARNIRAKARRTVDRADR